MRGFARGQDERDKTRGLSRATDLGCDQAVLVVAGVPNDREIARKQHVKAPKGLCFWRAKAECAIEGALKPRYVTWLTEFEVNGLGRRSFDHSAKL